MDALLDRLDFLWKDGLAPDLNELLTDVHDPVARAELCAADLEWRWRSQGSGPIMAWSASNYQAMMGTAWSLPACRQLLIDAEWLARSAWGDKPHIDHFVAHQVRELAISSVFDKAMKSAKRNSTLIRNGTLNRSNSAQNRQLHAWIKRIPKFFDKGRIVEIRRFDGHLVIRSSGFEFLDQFENSISQH